MGEERIYETQRPQKQVYDEMLAYINTWSYKCSVKCLLVVIREIKSSVLKDRVPTNEQLALVPLK